MLRRSSGSAPARDGRRCLGPAILLLLALGGCSAAIWPAPAPEQSRSASPALPSASQAAPAASAPSRAEPARAPAQEAAPAPTPPAPAIGGTSGTSDALLAYLDGVANLPAAELAQEIRRLGDPADSAPQMMRLAIALAQTRTPANITRAQSLLRRVLAQDGPEAQALHPLARLLLAHGADARRLEDQLEKQSQQLREALRRVDLLTERLEAVRAIERSLPSKPPASGAAGGQR